MSVRSLTCGKDQLADCRMLLIAVLFIAISNAPAQEQEQRLRLDPLIEEALQVNPEIRAAQNRHEALRQRPAQEGTLPDPIVSIGYNSVGSPRPVAGLGGEPMANAGVMVAQEFPFPGTLRLRGAVAEREAEAEFQQYLGARLSVISRLKQAYYGLYYAYAASDVLTRTRDLLEKLLRIAEARYAVGRAEQQDIFRAQTEISIIEARLIQLERERETREAEINTLLNRSPGTPLQRPAEVSPPQFAVTLDELYASARDYAPALRREQRLVEREEVSVNLARRGYYPDFALNAGYFYRGSLGPMYMLRADFTVPAYFWRRQRAAVAEGVAARAAAQRTFETATRELLFRVKDNYLMASTSWRLMRLYSRTVVPQASLTLESSLASYETGRVDFITVLANFVTVLEYEFNYYQEVLGYTQALSRLEEITGRTLLN